MAAKRKIPPMLTIELIQLIKANNKGISGVAKYFGVARSTVYNRLNEGDYVKAWLPRVQAKSLGLIIDE